jgi:hypothetical protein
VNLYSREYFALMYDRLNPGGVATYWLPVEELDEDDARAVAGAFCAAFVNCSLWTGAGPHWMLAGTRGIAEPASEATFTAQWRDATVGPDLIRLGFETPEQLGATFLADRAQLAPWIGGLPPLDDDHPHRLSPRRPDPARQDFIERWMGVEEAAARFDRSEVVARLWPPALRARTRARFPLQRLVNAVTTWPRPPIALDELREVLEDATLRTLPLLMTGSSPVLQDIARRQWESGARSATLEAEMGFGALARREYAAAAKHLAAAAAQAGPEAADVRRYLALALRMGVPANR